MAVRRTVSISLSPELQAVAEGLRATGRYGNISDVMRAALRLLEERELEFLAHREACLDRLPVSTTDRHGPRRA